MSKQMNFDDVDLLPVTSNQNYLGSNEQKWIIDASQLTGTVPSSCLGDIGNCVFVGDSEPTEESCLIWIQPN